MKGYGKREAAYWIISRRQKLDDAPEWDAGKYRTFKEADKAALEFAKGYICTGYKPVYKGDNNG